MLAPGDDRDAADGQGSITFDGVRRFATLQVAHDPGRGPGAGLCAARPGRSDALAVRAAPAGLGAGRGADDGGRTLVEVAGLARTEGEDRDRLADEVTHCRSLARAGIRNDDRQRTDEQLSTPRALSNNLLYSAMAVYTGAMYCYAAELAFDPAPSPSEGRSTRVRSVLAS